MNRHELLDALSALTDDELQATITEARAIDPSIRELVREILRPDLSGLLPFTRRAETFSEDPE